MIFTPQERRALLAFAALLLLGQGVTAWDEYRRSRPDRELSVWIERLAQSRADSLPAEAPPTGVVAMAGVDLARPDATAAAESSTVSVRLAGAPAKPARAIPPGVLESGRVRINEAGVEALEFLPGIGPALARRILEDRERSGPFRRPEDLLRVSGIGPKKLEMLREKIDLGDAVRSAARP